MIPPGATDYIGRDFGPQGCWDFVQTYYREQFSLEIGHYLDEAASGNWKALSPIEGITHGDLLLFTPDGICHHVGIAIDATQMIHASETIKAVTIEDFTRPLWKGQLKKRYRYRIDQ